MITGMSGYSCLSILVGNSYGIIGSHAGPAFRSIGIVTPQTSGNRIVVPLTMFCSHPKSRVSPVFEILRSSLQLGWGQWRPCSPGFQYPANDGRSEKGWSTGISENRIISTFRIPKVLAQSRQHAARYMTFAIFEKYYRYVSKEIYTERRQALK